MKKQFLIFCFLILNITSPLFAVEEAGKITLSGYLKDASNGESLIGATVYFKELGSGTTSNIYGFFSISVPRGKYTVSISYVGYKTITKTIALDQNLTMNIELQGAEVQLEELVVTGEKADANVQNVQMSVNKLDVKTFKQIPSFMGEMDVIRSVQMMPGVTTVGEGASGFNVRGGAIDHNLILLDEAPVYNSSHVMGMFSVFNGDALKDITLHKGGVPAQHGGRLASILDVRMKEGNNKEFHGQGGIGTIFSKLTLEGPIQKDQSSFIISGRRSYGDLFLKLSSDKAMRENSLYFGDLSAKVNGTINDNNRVFISGYMGRDVFKLGEHFQMSWGNLTGTVRWNHIFNNKLFSNFTAVYSDYDYNLGVPEGSQGFNWESHIFTYNAKGELSYYLNENLIP